MKYNPDIHHRQSIRLKGYDYANYWEHIIRNESEFDRIRTYIRNNPANLERDRFLRYAGLVSAEVRESIAVYDAEDWMI